MAAAVLAAEGCPLSLWLWLEVRLRRPLHGMRSMVHDLCAWHGGARWGRV